MHTAPAGGVALCEMDRAVGWLGTGKGAEREGDNGEEGGDCGAHFGKLQERLGMARDELCRRVRIVEVREEGCRWRG